MIECIILGDSIAVGTHAHRPNCVAYAKGGINSWQWNNQYNSNKLTAGTVIISLGTNDHKFVKTKRELLTMRERVNGKKVFWILPVGNSPKSGVPIEDIQQIIKEIATTYGDTVLPITRVQKDGIHPSNNGYREIAHNTKSPFL
jgi:lysophospholipase L1-like esterase